MDSSKRMIDYSSKIYAMESSPLPHRVWYWIYVESKVERQLHLHLTKNQRFILNKVSKKLALKMAKVKLLHYEGQGLCAISINGKTYKLD